MLEIESDFTDKELEDFARRILPVVKDFFMDDAVQKEFQEWKEKKKK